MDLIEKNRFNKFVCIAFIITDIYLIINNHTNKIVITLLVIIIGACIIYYNNLERTKNITKDLLLGIICLTYYLIFYIDETGIALIFIFIIIGMVTINYKALTGLLFVTSNFIITTSMLYIKSTNFEISLIFLLLIQFYFVYTVGFLLKYQMEQKNKLKILSNELKNRKVELESAYEKIQESMDLIEDLKQGNELLDFQSSIKALIKETEKSSSIKIHLYISNMPNIDITIQKTIHRSLQEGLTNGIKHGHSKEFDIVIKCKKDKLLCSIKDYGIGVDNIIPGFGLSNMKYQVEKLNGNLDIYSKIGEGTMITIKIPIKVN